jgi:threonine/homoserine/homoserine lactone efflux protein
MNWQEFTALLALATAMSFTPGPNTTLSTALAANQGLRHALPFVFAVPVGWAALLLLCAFGLGALILAIPALANAIKLVGVVYLLWLVWMLARTRPAQTSSAPSAPHWRPMRLFLQGVALQFVNIKAWMLALAIVSGWVAGRPQFVERLTVVLPVMMAYALASNMTYAVAGSVLRAWLAGPQGSGGRLMWFNRSMAVVLLATVIGIVAL